MAMSMGGGGSRRLMSEINVTPLVDVMLVLLIIFMVTAPMLQEGMSINVPQVKTGPLEQHEQAPLILMMDKAGAMSIDKAPIPKDALEQTLKTKLDQLADKTLYLRADQAVPYGFVVEAMATAKQAGATKLSMITKPPEEK